MLLVAFVSQSRSVRYGKRSRERLKTCHEDLQRLANEAIKIMDIAILDGHRDKQKQQEAYDNGHSKLKWPKSKHNKKPSLALDAAPYPINWNDIGRFERMCGVFEGLAQQMGIKIRLGRDFSFKDYPHIELIDEE